MPRNTFNSNVGSKLATLVMNSPVAGRDVILQSRNKNFRLKDIPGRIMIQGDSAAGSVLTSGYSAYAYDSAGGPQSCFTHNGFIYQHCLYTTVGIVRRNPVATTTSSTSEKTFNVTCYDVASSNGGALLKLSEKLGALVYQTGNGTASIDAFDLDTMTKVGTTVNGIGGSNNSVYYGAALVQYGGAPALAVATGVSGSNISVRLYTFTDAGGIAANPTWTVTPFAATDPTSLLCASPDGSKLAVANGAKVCVLSATTGATVGAVNNLSTISHFREGWAKSQASGALFVTPASVNQLRHCKIKWADGTMEIADTASCPAVTVPWYGGGSTTCAWCLFEGSNKLYIASGIPTAASKKYTIMEFDYSMNLTKTTVMDLGVGNGADRTRVLHLLVDEEEGVIYAVVEGYDATNTDVRCQLIDLTTYASIVVSAAITSTSTTRQGFGATFARAEHPIGGLSVVHSRITGSATKHIAPPGRAPVGVAMRAANAGQSVVALGVGTVRLKAAIMQTGSAVYDSKSSSPAGIKLAVNNGLATLS